LSRLIRSRDGQGLDPARRQTDESALLRRALALSSNGLAARPP